MRLSFFVLVLWTTCALAQMPEDVRPEYEAILAVHPTDAAALAGEVKVSERMALAARAAGDRDLALKTLLRAQTYAPDSAQLMLDLGILEDEMHLYLDADKVLVHAAELGSKDPNLLYAAGRVKLDLGQLSDAERNITAYLASRPDDASAHYALGRIYRQGVRLDQAKVEFTRSIALQPQQTEAYYQLGETQLADGQATEAARNFAVTLQRNPHHAGALTGAGIAYFKEQQYGLAVAPLRQAVAVEPNYQPAHYYLGLALRRLGQTDESARELAEAARLAASENRASAGRLRLYPLGDGPL